jgi:hypothetical protein
MIMKNYVIIAPHADDEIIGCHEVLCTNLVKTVIFGTPEGVEEALASSDYFRFERLCFQTSEYVFDKENIYLFPDPTYELHPLHRTLGALGEKILRDGFEVIFYSTNMSAPYIFEVLSPDVKRDRLNILYTSKRTLWEFEHKYFLFEGYVKWKMLFDKHE